VEVQLNSFLTSALEEVCGQHHAPAAFTPGKDPVPIVQEVGWALEPVWMGAENLAPPGFDLRTFQPVTSRYTDYAIPATNRNEYQEYFLGGKGDRCLGLTTLPPSWADCLEIWEPQPPGNLRACPGL
jgi:hypothetical protein